MKPASLAFTLCILAAGTCGSALAKQTPRQMAALQMMRGYYGNWQCTGGDPANREAGQVYFDAGRDRWIYQYMGATGHYAMMEGVPVGNQIRFAQMYPKAGMRVLVTNVTPRKYFETESYNGHVISSNTCVKV